MVQLDPRAMLVRRPSATFTSRRKAFGLYLLAGVLSTVLWLAATNDEWVDKVKLGIDLLPSISEATWSEKLWGTAKSNKPTAERFLNAYNAWKNASEGYCTPTLEQITVTMNGLSIADLDMLDVSHPNFLEITSECDGIPGVGDYYETLLTTPYYHGRINLYNQYDGRQLGEPLRLPSEMVDQGYPIRIQIWRLYRDFEGIENHKEIRPPFKDGKYTREEIVDVEIPLTGTNGRSVEDRPVCHGDDFDRHDWSGSFWWRKEETDESWKYYLGHCKPKAFDQEEASQCLAGRKLVFLGDSTAQDMVRNTLWTFLGDSYPSKTPHLPLEFARRGHWNTTHPGHPDRWTSMSYLFNGHHNLGANRLGMSAFRHEEMITAHNSFFDEIEQSGEQVDTLLINSGLHDAWVRWTPESSIDDFNVGWEYYMRKFREIQDRQSEQGKREPQVIYRYSNTPSLHLDWGLATPMNPSSMEMINLLQSDYLDRYNKEKFGGQLSYLDSYEATFPWHFTSEMNSGPHYGRAPWAQGDAKRIVDIWMVHLFLTRLCPDIALEL